MRLCGRFISAARGMMSSRRASPATTIIGCWCSTRRALCRSPWTQVAAEAPAIGFIALTANAHAPYRPSEWHHGENIDFHSRDYEVSIGALDDLIRRGNLTADAAIRVIHDAYRELPFEQAPPILCCRIAQSWLRGDAHFGG